MLQHVKGILHSFFNSPSFHVLRNLDVDIDLLDNKAFLLEEGKTDINGVVVYATMP